MIEKGYRDYSKLKKDIITRCPIELYLEKMKEEELLTEDEIGRIRDEVKIIVKDCIKFAKASPEPKPWQAVTDVFRGGIK